MKVEAADPKVSGELLFPPADGIIGIVIRFESRLPRSMTLLAREQKEGEKKKKTEPSGKKADRPAGGKSSIGGLVAANLVSPGDDL